MYLCFFFPAPLPPMLVIFWFRFPLKPAELLGVAHPPPWLRSRAWRVPGALQSVRVCMGLCVGAEEELAVSSMMTVFQCWQFAASSSVLVFLPGFPFCFESSRVSRSDVVSVFPCAQFLFLVEGGVKRVVATELLPCSPSTPCPCPPFYSKCPWGGWLDFCFCFSSHHLPSMWKNAQSCLPWWLGDEWKSSGIVTWKISTARGLIRAVVVFILTPYSFVVLHVCL